VRALVADDDRSTALMLRATLERWGLDVVLAHDGAEAWEILQSDRGVGLAIVDWEMPGVNGPEICRRVRLDVERPACYVLLLTSRNSRTDLITGLDAGADDYVVKPFDPDELRARVHVGLRVLALQARLADRVLELQAALANVKQLQGLLPICSYCKSVRTDQNYWERVEHYVSQHSAIKFSHGICPTCFDAVMAQLDES
jgi:DNA-binding response OmpR family regulator